MVFGKEQMKRYLGNERYDCFLKCIEQNEPLAPDLADDVAEAMKTWAVKKGATHYSHWFQPLTGITAEKRECFLDCTNGKPVVSFCGKNLIKGEPDASGFPSGGLRSTFEARGYTIWDPTSFAFIKDGSLCIPTAFCSFDGQALDKKTPLLKSMQALNKQAVRLLSLLGRKNVKRVDAMVGAEQEYFLIDKSVAKRRTDLVLTGHTLFGAKPPKGQDADNHYFGAIKPRVRAFMAELDKTLWSLGVYAKTEHNEAAPSQHELAPVFTTVNLATDHNQLMMEIMKKTAQKYGFVCLLDEKPFEHISGSGKHNNWSVCTDDGKNLLEPGENPLKNKLFLLFLCAVLKAVDERADLLRASVASAANDRRLGSNEAPPAVLSVFLGDELTSMLESVKLGKRYCGKAVSNRAADSALQKLPKDLTDRNRTSPFAFTGNKFEFRMVGSSASVASPNIVLNTAVADALSDFADYLEANGSGPSSVGKLLASTLDKHWRVIFNGNSYSAEWSAEAADRGLPSFCGAPEAYSAITSKTNVRLFEKHKVFTGQELESRRDVLLESYCKSLLLDASTMLDVFHRQIVPAVNGYVGQLANTACLLKEAKIETSATADLAKRLSGLLSSAQSFAESLSAVSNKASSLGKGLSAALCCQNELIPAMKRLRGTVDTLECLTDKRLWPMPSYVELLFGDV